jgi:formate hydrogenlyase subunit 3/multisubunit Na+/H+ antiporter MnhD subunit
LDNILLIPVFLPLIVGFILLFLPNRFRYLSAAVAMIVSIVMLSLSIRLFRLGPLQYAWQILQIGDIKLALLLKATPLGSFILMFTMGFGVLVTLYSLGHMRESQRLSEYYGSILLALGGSAGILLSDHLLFLLIFWEIVTASLYLLIAVGGRNSNFAATKTFAIVGASDGAFLLGIGFVWALTRDFTISSINLSLSASSPLAAIAFLLLVTAAITKAGALPLHTWLPTSGQYAPTPVMAFLPAAIDKLLGIYLLVLVVREIFVLDSQALAVVLAVVGAATIIIAVMVAMVQHNLKKLLSFHAVSQVGYMILGIATMTPVGIAGGLFHMLNNAIYKSCLFLCGGAVEQRAGSAELDQLGGLGRKMPLTFASCLIAALSISGIPPLNGFVSKWMVYQGIVQMGTSQTGTIAKLWPIWFVAAMFGSALTLASFVKVLHSVFFARLPGRLKAVREVPISQTLPMIVLAVLCVFFGVFYRVPLTRFIYPALGITGGTEVLTGTWDSILATGLIVVGIALGLLIMLIASYSRKVRSVPTWTCGEIQPNEQMAILGTHFYKTVSSMGGFRQLYAGQEKGYFDLYNQSGRLGLAFTAFLRWLHSGVLPMYLTWVTVGLVIVLFVVCRIW